MCSATPFFNPSATTDYFKRIVLLLDDCPEEIKSVIRSIYPQDKHDEISAGDATELLERSRIRGRDGSSRATGAASVSATTSSSSIGGAVRSSTSVGAAIQLNNAGSQSSLDASELHLYNSNAENIRQILIYPQGKGGISINTEDYMCLAIDQYLNDVIIDFYLKYLLIERLTAEQRERTHVFSTFFYKRLTTLTTTKRGGEQAKMTASQKRHFRVKNWTKGVNLFEKDCIIIPINEQSHWFLAIVCFPSLKGPRTINGDQPVLPSKRTPKRARDRKRVAMQIGSTTITPVSKTDMVFVDEDDERDEAEGDESDLAGEDSDTDTTTAVATPTTTASAAVAPAPAASPPDPNKAVPVKQYVLAKGAGWLNLYSLF